MEDGGWAETEMSFTGLQGHLRTPLTSGVREESEKEQLGSQVHCPLPVGYFWWSGFLLSEWDETRH